MQFQQGSSIGQRAPLSDFTSLLIHWTKREKATGKTGLFGCCCRQSLTRRQALSQPTNETFRSSKMMTNSFKTTFRPSWRLSILVGSRPPLELRSATQSECKLNTASSPSLTEIRHQLRVSEVGSILAGISFLLLQNRGYADNLRPSRLTR